jgi:uncharacterized protein
MDVFVIDFSVLFLACLAALLAGFIDSVVGGGGLIQIPALFILFPNFPVPRVIGTNRFSSFMGTGVAAWQYIKRVEVPWRVVLIAALMASVFSYLGARASSLMPAAVLKPIMLVLMTGIAIYTYRNKTLGHEENLRLSPEQLPWLAGGLGAATGFYNGFVGPGTGSLLVFGFVSLLGFDFLRASAQAKVINVVADVSSLIFFVSNGYVTYELAVPMMLCNMAGSFVGSRMAIGRGSAFIRILFLMMVFGLMARFGYEVLRDW